MDGVCNTLEKSNDDVLCFDDLLVHLWSPFIYDVHSSALQEGPCIYRTVQLAAEPYNTVF